MKSIICTMLLLLSINAFAYNWKKVSEYKDRDSFYIDVDNIKKRDGFVYYWVLSNYLEPIDGDYSYISKLKVDCAEEKLTYLSFTNYSEPMGEGRITSEDNKPFIHYPKPNEPYGFNEMKFACNY